MTGRFRGRGGNKRSMRAVINNRGGGRRRRSRDRETRRVSRSPRNSRERSRRSRTNSQPRVTRAPRVSRFSRRTRSREVSPRALRRSVSRESRDLYSPGSAYRGSVERNPMQFSPPRRNEFPGANIEGRPLNFEPPITDSFNYNKNDPKQQPQIKSWNNRDWNLSFEEEPEKPWEIAGTSNFISPDEGHPEIPMYDHTDPNITPRQWIKKIDEIGNRENWGIDQRKFNFVAKLAGAPKEWYLQEHVMLEAWNKLKKNFYETFRCDMDFHRNLTKMFACNKLENETYSNYFTHKTVLLKKCGISGRKAVSCIIGGLNGNDLKNAALDENLETPELLYGFLNSRMPMNDGMVCQGCKKHGHSINECPDQRGAAEMIPNLMANAQRFINPRYLVDVIINGQSLQGYNDNQAHCVTMREDSTFSAKLLHNRQMRIIRGYGGASIKALGDSNVLIRVGNAVVNMQVFVVPNLAQDVPVVIGNTLRTHPEVVFMEDLNGIHFSQKGYQPPQNSSFSMNEKLIQKMNEIRNIAPVVPVKFNVGNQLKNANHKPIVENKPIIYPTAAVVDKRPPNAQSGPGTGGVGPSNFFNPFNYQRN